MEYNLSDLLDIELNRKLLDNFCEAVGIGAAIIDLEGNVLIGSRWQRICTHFHRKNEKTYVRCIESDTILANKLGEGKKYVLYTCKNGMNDAASPIIVNGEHLANAFAGQFLLEKQDKEFFRKQAEEVGFDPDEYLSVLEEVPIIPKEKIPYIVGFLSSFAETVAQMSLEKILQKNTEHDLKERIKEINCLYGISKVMEKPDQSLDEIFSQSVHLLPPGWHYPDITGARIVFDAKIFQTNNFRETDWIQTAEINVKGKTRGKIDVIYLKQMPMLNEGPFLKEERSLINALAERFGKIIEQKIANTQLKEYQENLENLVQERTDKLENAAEALKISEQRFNLALNAANVGLWDINLETGITYFSPLWMKMIGYKPQELPHTYDTWKSLLHKDDKASAIQNFQNYLKATEADPDKKMEFDFRMVTKSGDYKWILACGQVVERKGKKPLRIMGTHVDITERKKAEETVKQSENHTRTILNTANEGFWFIDNDLITIDVNPAMCEIIEKKREDIIGKSILSHYDEKNKAILLNEIEERKNGKTGAYEIEMQRPDGSLIPCLFNATPYYNEQGEKIGSFAMVTDITEHKKMEEALHESELQSRLLLDSAQEGIFGVSVEGKITFLNSAASSMLGFKPEELKNRKIHEIIHHSYPDRSPYPVEKCPMYLAYATGKPSTIANEVLWRKDKSSFPVEYSSNPIFRDGKVTGAVITFRDISDLTALSRDFVALMDNSSDFIYLKDREHRFTAASQSYAKLAKMESWRDLKGKTVFDVFPDHFAKGYSKNENSVIENGIPMTGVEETYTTLSGKSGWVLTNTWPIKEDDGTVIGLIGISHDITDRKEAEKELEENRNFLYSVINNSTALIYAKDLSGKYILTNERWNRILGKEGKEALNKTDVEIFGEEYGRKFRKNDLKVLQSLKPVQEEEVVKIGKTDHTFISVKFPVLNAAGQPDATCGISTDITELKKAESKLRKANKKAQKAMKVSEEANKAKSDFLARMSHEIRTPMNAIIGLTHLALQTELTKKQKDYLSKVELSAHNLLGIINDILDFSKIEAGKLDIEETDFNLEEVMNNLSNMMSEKVRKKEIELLFNVEKDISYNLIGDPMRLGQILINLTNNALKFTESGEIIVHVSIKDENNDDIVLQFSVKDSGIGIPQDKIPTLFKEFTQADGSTTRKYGGTGLGLAICKRLAELMGGTIWVESTPGQGSTFHFTITAKKQKEVKEKRFIPVSELRNSRVLIVDDNQDARKIFRSYLENFLFDVEEAASGKEALEKIEHNAQIPGSKPFKLILLDWSMPGMDGIETATYIKDNFTLKPMPKIIMVTAFGREEIMKSAEKAGIEGFLIKPINQSVLFDTIMSVFGKEGDESDAGSAVEETHDEKLEGIRGASILLVEDNEINQQVAMELLEKEKLIVSIASNGKEALDAVENWDYDLVLMDLQMPVMDGITATKEIRKNAKFKDLPIIAMTAHAMAGDKEKSLEAGLNDHITKPIDPDQLYSVLTQWIEPGERGFLDNEYEEYEEEETETGLLPAFIPGIELSSALNRVGGNESLLKKLLLSFKESNESIVLKIKEALEDKEIERAQRIAHTLKGVAGNISAEEVYQRAAEVEAAIKNNDLGEIDKHLENLQHPLEFLIQSLSILEESETETEGNSVELDKETITTLLNEMKQYLEEDFTEAETRLEELKTLLSRSELGEDIKTLQSLIDQYDFDGAADRIDEIARKLETLK